MSRVDVRARRRRWARGTATSLAALLAVALGAGARGSGDRATGTPLQPPSHPLTVQLAAGTCQPSGVTAIEACGTTTPSAAPLLYKIDPHDTVNPGLVSRPWTVQVFVDDGANRWRQTLTTRPEGSDPGPLYAAVTAQTIGFAPPVGPALAIGYRSEGTGGFLDVDVIVAGHRAARVAAHLHLAQGVAIAGTDALVAYSAVYRAGDANCCPSEIAADRVFAHGRSVVVQRGRPQPVPWVHEPPGNLG